MHGLYSMLASISDIAETVVAIMNPAVDSAGDVRLGNFGIKPALLMLTCTGFT